MNASDPRSAWPARAWPEPAPAARWTFAPVLGLPQFGPWLAACLTALALLFVSHGQWRDSAAWRWMDVIGEGGITLMLATWLAYLRAARRAGPVTDWLCAGLAGMVLGAGVDLLDEFWVLPKDVLWDNWLESALTPLGMLALTRGLHLWRQEQLVINRQLQQREGGWRDHRAIDPLTQLADASHMVRHLEAEAREGRAAHLFLLGLQGVDALARREGLAAADRTLRDAALLLQLHLPAAALVCRYGGDCLVVAMAPQTLADADAWRQRLVKALAEWAAIRGGTQAPADAAAVGVRAAGLAWGPGASLGAGDALLGLLERLR